MVPQISVVDGAMVALGIHRQPTPRAWGSALLDDACCVSGHRPQIVGTHGEFDRILIGSINGEQDHLHGVLVVPVPKIDLAHPKRDHIRRLEIQGRRPGADGQSCVVEQLRRLEDEGCHLPLLHEEPFMDGTGFHLKQEGAISGFSYGPGHESVGGTEVSHLHLATSSTELTTGTLGDPVAGKSMADTLAGATSIR